MCLLKARTPADEAGNTALDQKAGRAENIRFPTA
jgi:hypothetical protein